MLQLAQFAYNNSRSVAIDISPNRALFGFNYAIRIAVVDAVPKGRILTA